MSYEGLNDDIEIEIIEETNLDINRIATLVRAQLLKQVRGKGDLYGIKYAQKRIPLASQPPPPGTQRIW